ncbi:MAG: DUF721 domain-containing protein [Beijerinckiaceae bacterium]
MSLPPKRKKWIAAPLADLVGKALDPVVAKQGFGESDIILHWDDIVGPRLAAVSDPIRLQWPPRPPGRSPEAAPEPATLVVRIEGAFALELQHLAPLVIERVNARLGWRCVGRIAMRQGPGKRAAARPARRAPDPQAAQEAQEAVAQIEDEGLRAALARLGAAAIAESRRKR